MNPRRGLIVGVLFMLAGLGAIFTAQRQAIAYDSSSQRASCDVAIALGQDVHCRQPEPGGGLRIAGEIGLAGGVLILSLAFIFSGE